MHLRDVLTKMIKGELGIDEAEKLVDLYAVERVENFAKLDVGREIRRGIPEIIYAENKSYEELKKIALAALNRNGSVIISRIRDESMKSLIRLLKKKAKIAISEKARTLVASKHEPYRTGGKVGIITAGTSDIAVAEEARLVVEAMGCSTITSYDVGIAGIHRVFPILKKMLKEDVDVIIVVAGMEGALASVVTTLVDVPVIGIPTSVGYGFGSNGYAALASMLQSCTFGLGVMNIDNGIGGGALASIIANRTAKFRKK